MVMEALEGFGDRIKYDISGHSGEDNNISFLSHMRPPENNNERLKVLKEMHAHSQFCMSGQSIVKSEIFLMQKK